MARSIEPVAEVRCVRVGETEIPAGIGGCGADRGPLHKIGGRLDGVRVEAVPVPVK